VVGYSDVGGVNRHATEWSGGRVIELEGLPGSTDSVAYSINSAGAGGGIQRRFSRRVGRRPRHRPWRPAGLNE
jgi:hypothetical protein